ncbi:hypothetical protein PRIPAC_83582 [Pristionchus pacificus]|uniref:Uncharacterized protein n=1 Tax=Pristionchus pacificus TaxID=54126 RepID=A0A2A6CCD0_PRIPA|nr:hypothetical protein PRIPAC_83582 [Pristionchus pacificus]|eukprot:PDM75671.1 hypothetical protein PRIPAC_43807 [Pristionchus pacificus]
MDKIVLVVKSIMMHLDWMRGNEYQGLIMYRDIDSSLVLCHRLLLIIGRLISHRKMNKEEEDSLTITKSHPVYTYCLIKYEFEGWYIAGSSQMVGGYNWNGNSPLNTFTPPYTPPSQPIIGMTNNSQSWKMTPPSSQSTSQQFKNLMQPHEISSHIPELRMEKSGWNTPLKRPAENPRDTVVKKKKDETTNSDHWETSSSFTATYSDSDSLNDSFSSCSSQKSEFSFQSTSQSIIPSKTDASTECTVEKNDMSTQTDSPYSFDEEIQTLLKKLLDHPEFVSFTNLLSSQIDEDEELLSIVDRSFAIDGEQDGGKK